MRVLQLLFCFSIIFFPKIGFIDLSLVVPLAVLPFVLRRWQLPAEFTITATMIGILFVYQTSVQMAHSSNDVESALRLIRAALSTILVGLFCGTGVPRARIYQMVFVSIVIQAGLVILAANIPRFNELLIKVPGLPSPWEARSTGMLGGFDISGFIICIGCAMVALDTLELNVVAQAAFVAFFYVACTYSSRVSMALCQCLLGLFTLKLVFATRHGKVRFLVAVVLASLFVYYGHRLYVIADVSLGTNQVDVDEATAAQIREHNAVQREGDYLWFSSMLFLPPSFSGKILGLGYDPIDSDIGYVKDIFRFGVVGLGVATLAYLIFVLRCFHNAKPFRYLARHKALVFGILIVTAALNAKNSYIFVRAIYPATLLLVYSVCGAIASPASTRETSRRGLSGWGGTPPGRNVDGTLRRRAIA
jgi:hypothetical protein